MRAVRSVGEDAGGHRHPLADLEVLEVGNNGRWRWEGPRLSSRSLLYKPARRQPTCTSQGHTGVGGASMVIALVALNWASARRASPGRELPTSAEVAPHRRCHLPVERRRQQGWQIVDDIGEARRRVLAAGWPCNVGHLGHIPSVAATLTTLLAWFPSMPPASAEGPAAGHRAWRSLPAGKPRIRRRKRSGSVPSSDVLLGLS